MQWVNFLMYFIIHLPWIELQGKYQIPNHPFWHRNGFTTTYKDLFELHRLMFYLVTEIEALHDQLKNDNSLTILNLLVLGFDIKPNQVSTVIQMNGFTNHSLWQSFARIKMMDLTPSHFDNTRCYSKAENVKFLCHKNNTVTTGDEHIWRSCWNDLQVFYNWMEFIVIVVVRNRLFLGYLTAQIC